MEYIVEIRAKSVGMEEAVMAQGEVRESIGLPKTRFWNWCRKTRRRESLHLKPGQGRKPKIQKLQRWSFAKQWGKRRRISKKLAKRLTEKG